MRRLGEQVFRILAPRDAMGSPIVQAIHVDEYVRGVSIRSAKDAARLDASPGMSAAGAGFRLSVGQSPFCLSLGGLWPDATSSVRLTDEAANSRSLITKMSTELDIMESVVDTGGFTWAGQRRPLNRPSPTSAPRSSLTPTSAARNRDWPDSSATPFPHHPTHPTEQPHEGRRRDQADVEASTATDCGQLHEGYSAPDFLGQ